MNGVNWLLMRNIRIKHAKMRNAFYAMGSCNCVIYSDSSEVVWISIQRFCGRVHTVRAVVPSKHFVHNFHDMLRRDNHHHQ